MAASNTPERLADVSIDVDDGKLVLRIDPGDRLKALLQRMLLFPIANEIGKSITPTPAPAAAPDTGRPWLRRFTPEQDKAIAADYIAGASVPDLRAKHGGTDTSLKGALRRENVVLRSMPEALVLKHAQRREAAGDQISTSPAAPPPAPPPQKSEVIAKPIHTPPAKQNAKLPAAPDNKSNAPIARDDEFDAAERYRERMRHERDKPKPVAIPEDAPRKEVALSELVEKRDARADEGKPGKSAINKLREDRRRISGQQKRAQARGPLTDADRTAAVQAFFAKGGAVTVIKTEEKPLDRNPVGVGGSKRGSFSR